jgi:hypothetical protein
MYGPNAILGSTGTPFASGSVEVYQSDGMTAATLYTDQTMGTGAANPTTCDSYGNLHFYAQPGIYVLSFTIGGTPTTLTVQVLPWYTNISPGTVVEAYIAGTVNISDSSPTNITSVSLVAGTWLIVARANFVCLAGPSPTDAWIGPTSASATGLYAADSISLGDLNYGVLSQGSVTIAKSVTLGSTTTVHLEAIAGDTGVVAQDVGIYDGSDLTGITAVRTA